MIGSGLTQGTTFLSITLAASLTVAQQAPVSRPYDGIQAGLDAYRLAEEQRQAGVSQQLFLNDQLKFWNGLPTSRGETIYYGYVSPAFGGYGWPGSVGWNAPLPYTLGGIYGYPYYSFVPTRQPIGQRQEQTGANRWESHPVYSPPVTNYRPLPPVESPLLERTPYSTPRNTIPAPPEPMPPGSAGTAVAEPTMPPAPAPRRGPREY